VKIIGTNFKMDQVRKTIEEIGYKFIG